MKHSYRYDILTSPDLPMEAAFGRISYALFRTDAAYGQVLAARFPDRELLDAGDLMQMKLRLSDEAIGYLLHAGPFQEPLFVMTEAGLGILSKRYDAAVGVGLYLHIHCRPEAGARLLCAGALGEATGASFSLSRRVWQIGREGSVSSKDTESFGALLTAWRMVQSFGDLSYSVGENGLIRLSSLTDVWAHWAAFAGCGLQLPVGADRGMGEGFLRCCRPLVLEALLLYLFTEARTWSTTRCVSCEWGAGCLRDSTGSRWEYVARQLPSDRAMPGPIETYNGYADHSESRYARGIGLADGREPIAVLPSISFSYPMDTGRLPIRASRVLMDTRNYLRDMADLAGLDVSFPRLYFATDAPVDAGILAGKNATFEMTRAVAHTNRTGSPATQTTAARKPSQLQTITLEWLTDPSLLPSGDLKTRRGLRW